LWVVCLASLAALTIFALWVPIDIGLHVNLHGRPKFSIKVAWLFGLVSKEIRKGRKRAEKGRLKPGRKRIDARTIFGLWRTKGVPRHFKRLLKDILSQLRIRDVRINLRVGLDDPADTGLLCAIIGPATLLWSPTFIRQIRMQPVFDEAVFEGCLHGTVRLHPAQLVIPFTRFALSLTTIRVVKTLVLSQWKGKS